MKNEFNSDVTGVNVQIITFRDLECDAEALEKTNFFELPSDQYYFERGLANIVPRGGGDNKESGLEALYTAMLTNWKARGSNDRQLIALFTDSDAIGFTEKRDRTGYPDMFDENKFIETWMCHSGNATTLQERNKRLVMFAPEGSVYKKLQGTLNRSVFNPVIPLGGMKDIDFTDIIKTLCASASAV